MQRDERRELEGLLSRLCDAREEGPERLDDAEFARLEELLRTSAEHRRFYLQYIDQHARLTVHPRLALGAAKPAEEGDAWDLKAALLELSQGEPDRAEPSERTRRFRWNTAAKYGLTAAATLAASWLVQSWMPVDGEPATGPIVAQKPVVVEPTPAVYVATLRRSIQGVFAGPASSWQRGARVMPGSLELTSGTAEFRFDGGSELLLTGPAVLKVESPNSATLVSGRAVFRSDETAEPFELRTPTSVVTDLGTEYGLVVEPSGAEEIHVFDGEVVRTPPQADKTSADGSAQALKKAKPKSSEAKAGDEALEQRVTMGQAARFQAKKRTEVPLDRQAFVRELPAPTQDDDGFGLLAQESFSTPGSLFPGPKNQGNSTGWKSNWRLPKGASPLTLAEGGLRRPDHLQPDDRHLSLQGMFGVSRDLAQPIRMDQDGLYYFSFLFRRHTEPMKIPMALALIFRRKPVVQQEELAIGVARKQTVLFSRFEGGGDRVALPLDDDKTYLLVGKIVAGKDAPDQVLLRVYRPEEALEAEEPENWSLVTRPVHSNLVYDMVTVHVNSSALQEFDELRLGSTWSSVVSPWQADPR